MPLYTHENPSPRYQQLLAMYCNMHDEGDSRLGITAENMFNGKSLPPHAMRIKKMIAATGTCTTLDYGCGKAALYHSSPIQMEDGKSYENIKAFWGVDETSLYDPAYKPYSTRPAHKADLVICTDVMEHCPEQDVVWILKDIFSLATKGVYLNISAYPARKTLPNGENAHCTVRPQHWWQGALTYVSAGFPGVAWQCWLDVIEQDRKQSILIEG